jgi:hypothetical protein
VRGVQIDIKFEIEPLDLIYHPVQRIRVRRPIRLGMQPTLKQLGLAA